MAPEQGKGLDTERIQQIIGMAVTDEHFRRQLFEDAESACRKAGFNLSELELAALKNLKADCIRKGRKGRKGRISMLLSFSSFPIMLHVSR
ncbi:Franean1_4349 family RiPP [Candidatus Poribacteria bacterium]|nr:Franean1_4349 family RiPP [Candidatus Poribacteria bacterium]